MAGKQVRCSSQRECQARRSAAARSSASRQQHRAQAHLPPAHLPPLLPPCSAQIDCDVPLEEAFALWEDRERIPQWMPWITSVVVQQAGGGWGGISSSGRPARALIPAEAHTPSSEPRQRSCGAAPLPRPLQDDPRLSRWTLSTYQFNRQWEFSWLALNLTPLRNQKIHWRSVPGSTGGSLGSALEVQNRWGRQGRGGRAREGDGAGVGKGQRREAGF